ncbi:MAG: nucleotide disphospho-sugar-binding domain-containing protein, partial [Chloroflexota bacterium]
PVVYRAVLDALADLPIRVLMTVGEAVDPVALGPLPANASVERWVPQAEILPRVAVVVGHGGYGTVLGALAAARPMVILPLFADQPVNAARVAALGAGLALPGGAVPDPGQAIASVHLLPEAVTRVLSDPTFTQAAGRVAAEIGELPPVDAAVGMLAAL